MKSLIWLAIIIGGIYLLNKRTQTIFSSSAFLPSAPIKNSNNNKVFSTPSSTPSIASVSPIVSAIRVPGGDVLAFPVPVPSGNNEMFVIYP